MWCRGEVGQYDTGDTWCQGEACQYDTDTDTGDNYYARDEAADDACQDMGKSSNARVARKETTDEAPDDGH